MPNWLPTYTSESQVKQTVELTKSFDLKSMSGVGVHESKYISRLTLIEEDRRFLTGSIAGSSGVKKSDLIGGSVSLINELIDFLDLARNLKRFSIEYSVYNELAPGEKVYVAIDRGANPFGSKEAGFTVYPGDMNVMLDGESEYFSIEKNPIRTQGCTPLNPDGNDIYGSPRFKGIEHFEAGDDNEYHRQRQGGLNGLL